MAHIITLHILVDAVDPRDTIPKINALLTDDVIVDWAYGAATPISDELADTLINETYTEGDFHKEIPR